jgi:hypothetical protein
VVVAIGVGAATGNNQTLLSRALCVFADG